MFDKAPSQRRSATGSGVGGAQFEDAKAVIERELAEIVRRHLEREIRAADVIQKLSYRIDQGSELATRARGYAGRLKLLVARISVLLPAKSDDADTAPPPGICSDMIIQSLDATSACKMLTQFLLHHAPIPSATLISAGERLRSKGFERLWDRVVREREKIANWIEAEELLSCEEPLQSYADVRIGRAESPREQAKGRSASDGPGMARDEDDDSYMPAPPHTARIFYNPPQIVRWM